MILSETGRNTVNFLLFQAGWFVCVLYPGLAATGLAVLILATHLMLVSRRPGAEVRFMKKTDKKAKMRTQKQKKNRKGGNNK